MSFCREFKTLPEPGSYFDQPADTMLRWHDYIAVEGEAHEMRRKIDEAQSKARRN